MKKIILILPLLALAGSGCQTMDAERYGGLSYHESLPQRQADVRAGVDTASQFMGNLNNLSAAFDPFFMDMELTGKVKDYGTWNPETFGQLKAVFPGNGKSIDLVYTTINKSDGAENVRSISVEPDYGMGLRRAKRPNVKEVFRVPGGYAHGYPTVFVNKTEADIPVLTNPEYWPKDIHELPAPLCVGVVPDEDLFTLFWEERGNLCVQSWRFPRAVAPNPKTDGRAALAKPFAAIVDVTAMTALRAVHVSGITYLRVLAGMGGGGTYYSDAERSRQRENWAGTQE